MKSALRDVIPLEKRSIRDVPLPSRKEVLEEVSSSQSSYKDIEQEFEVVKRRNPAHKKKHVHKGGKGMWTVALLSVFSLAFILILIFAKTTVTLDLKKVSFKVEDLKLLAEGDAEAEASFRFSTVSLKTEDVISVEASGKKDVAIKATGTVLLYNNFSTAPQQLIAGTRLEDPNGLIFKLQSPVTIPGKKTVSGKSVPGSVEVKVIASEAGEKYNINLTDFTIPGFKGTAKFNGFYGRSKTNMTGGMFGTVAVVDTKVLEDARATLRSTLTQKAIEKVKAELPEGFVFPKGSFTTTFTSFEPINGEEGKASVKEEVTIEAFVFKQENLLEVLAKELNVTLVADQKPLPDFSSLSVSSVSTDATKALFVFSGAVRSTYFLDHQGLKNMIAGKSKKEVPKILAGIPIIEKAQLVVSPFWFRKVTSNLDKIFIQENKI